MGRACESLVIWRPNWARWTVIGQMRMRPGQALMNPVLQRTVRCEVVVQPFVRSSTSACKPVQGVHQVQPSDGDHKCTSRIGRLRSKAGQHPTCPRPQPCTSHDPPASSSLRPQDGIAKRRFIGVDHPAVRARVASEGLIGGWVEAFGRNPCRGLNHVAHPDHH